MPINITQNNTAQFTFEFLDTNGNLTIPSSATLTIVYTPLAGGTATATIGLTLVGSFFTGIWNSAVAALGLYTYSVNAPGQLTTPAGTGQIRVIDP
jgi:hypothetical protein